MLGPVTASILSLFALYQGVEGAWVSAGLSAGLGLVAIWRAFRMRNSSSAQHGGLWLALLDTIGCLLAIISVGTDALPWTYLVLISNYFICDRRKALILGAPLLLALTLVPDLITSWAEGLSVITVTLLTIGLGYAVSHHLQHDWIQLEEMASLDALTGLPNRRMLERAIERQVAEQRDHNRLNGLIILDIDHFKEVNDLYGHTTGDAALADLSTILRFELRGEDQVFRFGGEEFVILLRAESVEDLELITERVRQAVHAGLRGPGGRITISLGAARYAGESHWQDWFSRADAALYLAKNSGRDSYRIADQLE